MLASASTNFVHGSVRVIQRLRICRSLRRDNKRFSVQLRNTVAARDRWLARNEQFEAKLTSPAPNGFGAFTEDAETAKAISRWIYGRTG
jgi:hypothetical protein